MGGLVPERAWVANNTSWQVYLSLRLSNSPRNNESLIFRDSSSNKTLVKLRDPFANGFSLAALFYSLIPIYFFTFLQPSTMHLFIYFYLLPSLFPYLPHLLSVLNFLCLYIFFTFSLLPVDFNLLPPFFSLT